MAGTNDSENWADLYRAALFEEDRRKLPQLLKQAHRAVKRRVRELWYASTRGQSINDKERHELHTAAYYLDLLLSLEARKSSGGGRVATMKPLLTGLWTSET